MTRVPTAGHFGFFQAANAARTMAHPACTTQHGMMQPQTSVFLRSKWPHYQGGLRQNPVRLAESRRNEAQTALEASSTTALYEVEVAYDQVRTGLGQYDAVIVLRSTAQTTFDAASDAFARGVGSFTDAVNASTALDGARAAVARAHAQALVNAASLAFATGAVTSSTDLESSSIRALQ